MALASTVFRVELQLSDLDRQVYRTETLTLARHPSETDERMMVRLLAYALNRNAEEEDRLAFGTGLSTADEPALWRKDYSDAVDLWIDVGLPDSRQMKKACARAGRVTLYAYGRNAPLWWKQNRAELTKLPRLSVICLPAEATQRLSLLAARGMRLNCLVQENEIRIGSQDGGAEDVVLTPEVWKEKE